MTPPPVQIPAFTDRDISQVDRTGIYTRLIEHPYLSRRQTMANLTSYTYLMR